MKLGRLMLSIEEYDKHQHFVSSNVKILAIVERWGSYVEKCVFDEEFKKQQKLEDKTFEDLKKLAKLNKKYFEIIGTSEEFAEVDIEYDKDTDVESIPSYFIIHSLREQTGNHYRLIRTYKIVSS